VSDEPSQQSDQRWVLHVDLDMFLAAVEVLRRPELAGLPVVVGGRGVVTERAVVSTASYEARELGIRSGMPLRRAHALCPDAVFLPVDFPVYEEASTRVMAALRSLEWGGVPVVLEVLGWDEAFLGAGEGHDDLGDEAAVRAFADQVRAAVLGATRLHCSVGIGNNKLQAKIATDFGKPRGVYAITDDRWYDEMGDRPVRALWGIGAKIAGRLSALGITTVRELAASSTEVVAAEFGPRMGPWFHRLGRGVDSSPVDATPWVPRAHGHEETFQRDLEWPEVPDAVRRLTARALASIDAEGRPAARVHLKVRYRNFFTLTRSRTLPESSRDLAVLEEAAVALLERVEQDKPVRLLGVRLEMVPPEGGYDR
jgi:DNA polymerase-4